MLKIMKSQSINKKEIVNYFIFGVLTTLINWSVYALMVGVFNVSIHLSNAIAWLLAVAFAFITNKIWVFNCLKWNLSALIKEGSSFLGSRIISGIFEMVALPIFIGIGVNQSLFGVEGFSAKILVTVIVTISNYVFSKWFIFKK